MTNVFLISWATITHFCTENSATVYTLKSPDLGLLHELTPLATAIQTFRFVFSKILSRFKPYTFWYKTDCVLYWKHQISFIFDQDRIMKNFIWIAIFFTVGYATPIPQVGGKQRIFSIKPRDTKLGVYHVSIYNFGFFLTHHPSSFADVIYG